LFILITYFKRAWQEIDGRKVFLWILSFASY